MILFEFLRLFFFVFFIGRRCIKENKVGLSLVILEGLEIVILVVMLYRDRNIWGDNVDEFLFVRFGNGISGVCGSLLVFIFFGVGFCICIG